MPQYEKLDSQSVFNGKVIKVYVDRVRLSNGREVDREIVRHPGSAAIVAIHGGKVLLVRQMRYPVGEELLEIPAGKLDVDGEKPEECVRRELIEETGFSSGPLELLASFYSSPGFTDELVHVFLTKEVIAVSDPPADDQGELISIEWLTETEVRQAVNESRILDAKTIIGLALARVL